MLRVVSCAAAVCVVSVPRLVDRSPASVALTFVGEPACASCHANEAAAWRGSHHERAMQPATQALGDFNATFTHAGVTTEWFRRDGKPMVRTEGAEYEVRYTFGVAPLQQYLVGFPGGRFQALEVAWDSRPKADGGQRWFHLYPDEHIERGDELHWTGVAENWNYMCADCHSTNVRKSWSAQSATYATTFAEVSVSCEACHGPGSRHVAWASKPPARRGKDNGLAIALDERRQVFWSRDPTTNRPTRSRPRTSDREIEMCARCHSRRGLVNEDTVHGQPVGDDYAVALLDDDLYYPDGQIKGEVYEYGSFLQSRMFAHGVSCSDCHDPHTQKLRAPGDNVCLQCHAERYATAQHHFHPAASAGARCVSCHMPATTYMVVDARRDHSLRIPRPDLSVKLGVPNACTGCHTEKSASWAERTVQAWYPHAPAGFQQFAEALASGTPKALAALVGDRSQPAIARATAIARLERWPAMLAGIRDVLHDPSDLVRRAAVHALAATDPQAVAPLLDDPVRTVRIEAALALADLQLPSAKRAIGELVAARQLAGDRPEAHLTLALLSTKQRQLDVAEAELKQALAIEPRFVPATINLADLYRALGRDADAEPLLRDALVRSPDHPALLHALGLVLVRQRRANEALDLLAAAARSGNARYRYVYAVALYSAGRSQDALRELEDVVRRDPQDRDSLAALAAFHRERGDARKARGFAEQLEALDR